MAFDFLGGGGLMSPGYAGGWFGGRGGGQGPNIFGDLNPRTVALFAMADKLAEAGKPQPYKTSTLGALPGAALAGLQGYGATRRSNLQTQAAELQLQELQRQAEQRKQQDAALQAMFAPPQAVPMQQPPGEPGTTTPYNGPGATYNPNDFPSYPAAPGQVTPYSGPGAQITPGPIGDPAAMLQQIQQRGQSAAPAAPTGIAGMFASLPPEVQQYARVNPEFAKSILAAYAQKQFKSSDPIKVGAGETLLDPNTRQPIFTGPTTPKELSGDLALIASIYPPGSPQYIAEVRRLLDAKAKAGQGEGNGGPYKGTGLEAQDTNVLLQGDPSSPLYAAAYYRQAAPKLNIDPRTGQIIEQTPDMRAYRPPTFQGFGAPQAQPAQMPAQAPPQAAPPPMAATAGLPALEQPAPAPVAPMAPPAQAPAAAGVSVRNLDIPPRPSATDLTKLKGIQAEGQSIISALEDFKTETKNAGFKDRAGAFFEIGGNKLNTRYNAASLLAKGEALFNLGVLNGPDLSIIRRVVSDPSTFSGATTSAKDWAEQIQIVQDLVRDRVAAFAKANNLPAPELDGPKVPKSGAEPTKDQRTWTVERVPEGK